MPADPPSATPTPPNAEGGGASGREQDVVPATAASLQRGTLRVLVVSNVLGGVAVASGFAVAEYGLE